jgi:hypothetical protein
LAEAIGGRIGGLTPMVQFVTPHGLNLGHERGGLQFGILFALLLQFRLARRGIISKPIINILHPVGQQTLRRKAALMVAIRNMTHRCCWMSLFHRRPQRNSRPLLLALVRERFELYLPVFVGGVCAQHLLDLFDRVKRAKIRTDTILAWVVPGLMSPGPWSPSSAMNTSRP